MLQKSLVLLAALTYLVSSSPAHAELLNHLETVSTASPSVEKAIKPPRVFVGAQVTNLIGNGGAIFPKGMGAFLVNYGYIDKSKVYVGGKSADAINKNRQDYVYAKFRYGFTGKFDMRAVIPYFTNSYYGAKHTLADRNNLADITVAFDYSFLNQRHGDFIDFAVSLVTILPTGEVSDKGLGTGSWALGYDIGATHRFGNMRHLVTLGTTFIYRFEGKQYMPNGTIDTLKYSNLMRIYGRYAYAATSWLDVGIETLFERQFGASKYGVDLNNVSSTWYMGPAINFKFPYRMQLGLATQIAVFNDFQNANINTGTGAASEPYRIEVKFTKAF